MAAGGRRYPLVVYEFMLNRWWPVTLLVGVLLGIMAWPISRSPLGMIQPWRTYTLLGTSAFVLLVTILLVLMRKKGYVQPFPDHLRLVTPFLRLNISYRRIRRTTTAMMGALFAGRRMSKWRRGLLRQLSRYTAVVIELNAFPVPPVTLGWFLSPFFFRDRTPHFVILVKDWMGFSAELESQRTSGPAKPVSPVLEHIEPFTR